MRSAVATRRQFLTVGGVALTGALVSRSVVSEMVRIPSALAGAGGDGSSTAAAASAATASASATATAVASPTPAPTPATVTIPVPVIQQSMVLDCETAALQQGLTYYGIEVGQPQLFAEQNADLRLPVMGANHNVVRWG